METFLLIIGIFLFIAWIIGLLISMPSLWRKIIGDPGLKYRIKRSFPVRRRKKAY